MNQKPPSRSCCFISLVNVFKTYIPVVVFIKCFRVLISWNLKKGQQEKGDHQTRDLSPFPTGNVIENYSLFNICVIFYLKHTTWKDAVFHNNKKLLYTKQRSKILTFIITCSNKRKSPWTSLLTLTCVLLARKFSTWWQKKIFIGNECNSIVVVPLEKKYFFVKWQVDPKLLCKLSKRCRGQNSKTKKGNVLNLALTCSL